LSLVIDNPSPLFQVVPFSISGLNELLAEISSASSSHISKKFHTIYFKEYFAALDARTIVVEKNYIDHDYLEDYSGYYARCFSDYQRKCTRLHFFQNEFSESRFTDLLTNSGDEKFANAIRDAYLGFIVAKPLPQTVIGRTCLKTYSADNGRRNFCTRTYDANLFGFPLSVETLAFQEQDTEAAACATSALWTAFHGTSKLFDHPIPSPVEITKSATVLGEHLTRSLPATDGLTANQMAKAIRGVQLEPTMVGVEDEYVLKSTLYSYLPLGIPILMTLALVNVSEPSNPTMIGFHAVTITGFSLGKEPEAHDSNFVTRASRIDKLYAHDDQVGPYSRMVFDGIKVVLDRQYNSISTSWGSSDGAATFRAVPRIFLIPVYHKIRIPVHLVHDTVFTFNSLLEPLRDNKIIAPDGPFEWDIQLTTVNNLKTKLRQEKLMQQEHLRNVLLQGCPASFGRLQLSRGINRY